MSRNNSRKSDVSAMNMLVHGLPVILLICLQISFAESVDLTYSVQEESGNTFIGNVGDDNDLRSTMTQEEYLNLVYRILSSGNNFAHYFKVINTTGELYTTDPIDRDSISQCSRSVTCQLNVDIAVQSTIGAFFRIIKVGVNVIDLNDNSPVFTDSTNSLVFLENSAIGTSPASIDGAQDIDAGNNSVVSYYVDTAGVPFDVIPEEYPDGSSIVKIVVTGELDRESKDFYQIRIVAEDGGTPRRSGFIDVNINIDDVNDNSPQFDRPFYNVTLNEDTPLNTVFETIKATDMDEGENGQIVYSISTKGNEAITDMYAINSTTGELSVIGQLVYMPNEQTRLYVDATDQGSQPRVSQIAVFVNIIDSSNNPPEINVNILQGDINARISEYANIGAPVAHIGVVDDDTGRNGKVECIGISEYFGLERYEDKEYKAVVTKSLNRELVQTHKVQIVCSDSGSPPMNSTATFTVIVNDENDNPPRFSQNTYFVKTEENNKVGEIVATVIAEDIDAGDNAQIEYKIINSEGYSFWIDPIKGEIRANFVSDRENVTQIKLTIKAEDKGKPKLSSTSTVILTISDQNDNYPIFSQPNYEFYVLEGVPNNTTVDQLTATDKDYRENGTVSFKFKTFPTSSFPFVLYSDGTIKMIRTLDREERGNYEFGVVAYDHGTNSLSSSVTVTISVLDVNDNAPVFVFPDASNNTAVIPLSSKTDSVAIMVVATDKDDGANGDVSYTLLDYNKTSLFYIENANGVGSIKLHRLPTSSESLQYNVVIKAEDNGKPKQSTITALTVVFTKDAADSGGQNFKIAIILGCVTVVLSLAIVITIYLIRRHDRRRQSAESQFKDKSDMEIVPDPYKPREELGSVSSDSKESLKKVSFSTGHNSSIEGDSSRDVTHTPLVNSFDSLKNPMIENRRQHNYTPTSSHYSTGPPDGDLQRLDPARVLQIHRSLVQSRDPAWTNHRDLHTSSPLTKELLVHNEDNGSESSAETATYDSGRGGSESDIQTSLSQSHDHDQSKTVTFANKPVLHHFTDRNQWRDATEFTKYDKTPPRSPRCHEITQPIPNNKKPTVPTREKLKTFSSSSHPGSSHTGSKLPTINDVSNHMTSYDDDDDTTTSGSYTIDNDRDWMNDNREGSQSYFLSHNEAYC
ncbi:hypothetical protein ACF0H5_010449 [Mactra antiquata]